MKLELLVEAQAWRDLAERVSNVQQASAYLCWWLDSTRYSYKDAAVYSLPDVSEVTKAQMLTRLKPHFAAKGISGVIDRLDNEAYIIGPRMMLCLWLAIECDEAAGYQSE